MFLFYVYILNRFCLKSYYVLKINKVDHSTSKALVTLKGHRKMIFEP
jgi:hypothetical protein